MLDIIPSIASRSLPIVGRRVRNIFIRPHHTEMRMVWASMVERILWSGLIWCSIMDMMLLRTLASTQCTGTGELADGCELAAIVAAEKTTELS
jgi:hypothetical protein